MPASASSTEARGALRAAIAMTAARLSPGNGVPHPRHLALIAESEPLLPPVVWTDAAALTLATQLAARGRQDALALGPGLIDGYFDGVQFRRPASLSVGIRAQLYASVAEYCCALGWTHVGARFAAEALLFADTPALRYRAHATGALAHAMNGEFATADDEIRRADDLFVAHGWDTRERAYCHFVAEITATSSRADAERLREIGIQMSAAQPDDPYWAFTAGLADVMARVFSQDFTGALAASAELLFGSRRHTSHRAVRYYLVCLRSDMLVARGEFVQALSLLAGYTSPVGHGVCFDSQRSASLLHLGREREVIAVTEACAANEADHNLRTLAPLLARRAVALQRLGDRRRAVQNMEAVLLLTGRTGRSVLPYVMLPREEVTALLDAVAEMRPALCDVIDGIRAALPRISAQTSEEPVDRTETRMTTTERELAQMLPTSLSLGEIAALRGVSVNTVKSQARSIYSKLGVDGRRGAVDVLARSQV